MADLDKNHAPMQSGPQPDDLSSLFDRLGNDLVKLFDQKLSLLKVELKEELNSYVSGVLLITAGGIVTAVGFALSNIALAFAVSTLFSEVNLSQPAKYALGFVSTGIVYLIIGAIVIVIIKNRLTRQSLVPKRSLEELERDKHWLQNEL